MWGQRRRMPSHSPAAKAIADLRLGRVDEDTTSNVGVISGGTGGNIVPEWCTFLAEARRVGWAEAVAGIEAKCFAAAPRPAADPPAEQRAPERLPVGQTTE